MSVSISGCVTWVSSESRQYLSIWEKSLWQVYLIFLLETIQLLEYLDLFEWKYYRNILSSGFLHGKEISFCSQNFVRGSQPLSQCWKTVGTQPLIKWKSCKEINPPQPMMEGPSSPHDARGWGVSRPGQHSTPGPFVTETLWRVASSPGPAPGLNAWQDRHKWKHKHKMSVNPVPEGSKLLVREYCSGSCAGRHWEFQRKFHNCGWGKGVEDLDLRNIQSGFVFSQNYFWLLSSERNLVHMQNTWLEWEFRSTGLHTLMWNWKFHFGNLHGADPCSV